MVRTIVVVACSLAVFAGSALSQEKVTDDQYADLQKNFAEAYNRKDTDAMAAAFTEMLSGSHQAVYSKAVMLYGATCKKR